MEVEAVWELIDRVCEALPAAKVRLEDALGLSLAKDVAADQDHPPFHRSAMDGYAVGENDDSESFAIIDQIRAGDSRSFILQRGKAVRILTGAELPGDGLRVHMQENAAAEAGRLRVVRQDPNPHIRRRGEDFQKGDVLLGSGVRLGAVELAILASVGVTSPDVIRKPRVLHFTGGDEIVPPEIVPGPGKIRDANSPLMRALLAGVGVADVRHAHLSDNYSVARAQVEAMIGTDHDMILFSGGASVGDYDITGRLLADMGYEIHCDKVNVRPGRPLILAAREGRVAFGIPGNPVSHFVCFNVFIKRALDRLMGRCPLALEKAVLAGPVPGKPNPRVTFWPARVEVKNAGRQVTPVPWNSSGHLASLAGVDALIRIESLACPESGVLVDCFVI